MDAITKQDLDALELHRAEAQIYLPELANSLVYAEPRDDAYNSRWFGVAIALIGACTLIAAALIAHAEAAL